MFPSDNYLISTVFSFKQHFPHLGIGSVLPCLNYSYLDQHSPLLNHCSNPAHHHLEPYIEYCKLSTIPHSQYHLHPHHSLNIIDGDWIHQNPYVLTYKAQLNVVCNTRARINLAMFPPNTQSHPVLPASYPTFRIHNQLIVRQHKEYICEHHLLPNYHQYLLQKFKWRPSLLATIEWSSIEHAILKFS